jgi:predicted deacylase
MNENENVYVPLEFISYEKYLWLLRNEADHCGISMEIVGSETCERTCIIYPIYRLIIYPQAQQNICIIAGIHGEEIAGPFAVINFLRSSVHLQSENFRFIIYPMINPCGFDLRQRYDDDYRDLNAIYADTLSSKNYREVQAFYFDAIKFQPFEAVITLHEDIDLDKFYIYGLGHDNRDFYHELCQVARRHCPPWSNADIYGSQSDEHGLILSTARDHAYDGALYAKGMTKIAYTLETPGKLAIEKRITLMVEWLKTSVQLLERKIAINPAAE